MSRLSLDGDASGRCVLLPDVLFGTAAHEWLAGHIAAHAAALVRHDRPGRGGPAEGGRTPACPLWLVGPPRPPSRIRAPTAWTSTSSEAPSSC